ncbi:hypothetical protein K2X85_00130 [bacterium]|nr:hypothetical protein [bacterium]
MPSRTTCGLIFLFWLVSTAWLVSRDVLPSLGLGEVTYERALSSRAVEEPVEWKIFRDNEEVGNVFFTIHPQPDSTFELESRAHLRVRIVGDQPTPIDVLSKIYIDPLKQLDHFGIIMDLSSSRTELHVNGVPKDSALRLTFTLRTHDQEQFKRTVDLPFDRQAMVLDVFGQLDRFPDLREGKVWHTQFINPLASLVGGGDLLPVRSVDRIQHRVVATEEIVWEKERVRCFKIEHRYQQAVTSSWARVSDGKVLVQEVLFGGESYRLVAERSIHDGRPPAAEEEVPR